MGSFSFNCKLAGIFILLCNQWFSEADTGRTGRESLTTDASNSYKILLITSKSGDDFATVRTHDKATLMKAGFKVDRKTVILIHGWNNNATSRFCTVISRALLKHRQLNVIIVDWSTDALRSYVLARASVKKVGKFTADFIDFLVRDVSVKISTIHLIGYSMGAHIAGSAGEQVTHKLHRITGLEPAGPLFLEFEKSERLDSSDAKCVDVIHTSAYTVGYPLSCGHLDFWPNGGTPPQPGCSLANVSCSHGMAYEYYERSVAHSSFVAHKCNSWIAFKSGACSKSETAIMGYNVDCRAKKGNYYLEIRA